MGAVLSLFRRDETSREMYDEYVSSPTILSDLSGKVVAITGTSVGSLGFFVAEAAVRRHAKLILLLNRTSARATKAEEEIQALVEEEKKRFSKCDTKIKTVATDLQSLKSVEAAAEELNRIAKEHQGLDVLCCNAGVMAMKDVRTNDGYEIQMQTNQLSHFLLIQRVMPSLEMAASTRGESRIVMHSSGARDMPNRMLEKRFFLKSKPGTLGGDSASMGAELFSISEGPWLRYHQTKLANASFAMALHDKLQASKTPIRTKIKSLVCEPGYSHSNLQNTSRTQGLMGGFFDFLFRMLTPGQSSQDGSLPCAMACFAPDAGSGDMYMPKYAMFGKPIKSIVEGKPVKKGGEKLTCHVANQRMVWESCEEALGVKFEV